MIVFTTLLIGMSLFQLLITFEWLRRQWKSLDELCKSPLFPPYREQRRYMLPPELIHQYPSVDFLSSESFFSDETVEDNPARPLRCFDPESNRRE
jgi:hypothetical protein